MNICFTTLFGAATIPSWLEGFDFPTLMLGIVAIINVIATVLNAYITNYGTKSHSLLTSKKEYLNKLSSSFSKYRIQFVYTPVRDAVYSPTHLIELSEAAYALASYCNQRSRNLLYEFVDVISSYYFKGDEHSFAMVYELYLKCVNSVQREIAPWWKKVFFLRRLQPEDRRDYN